jgi:hypothetical protein
MWALLSQMLFTGEQRSCRATVARVAAYYARATTPPTGNRVS